MPTKGLHILLPVALWLCGTARETSFAQCFQTFDLSQWKPTGDSATATACGNGWAIGSGNTEAFSLCETDFPKMLVGPDTLINVRITGKLRSEYADGDFIGFVFGFRHTYGEAWTGTNAMLHEYFLLDWKSGTETWDGHTAQEGMTLIRVRGNFERTLPTVLPGFWEHQPSDSFQILATNVGANTGWEQNQTYDFELTYTPTRVVVSIDSAVVFDIKGCFPPGSFGFYNHSQQAVRYWDFGQELYVDFLPEKELICLSDSARFTFAGSTSCNFSNTLAGLDTFFWDFGDGAYSTQVNASHLYTLPGTYTVKLVAVDTNACTDTASHTVTVFADTGVFFTSSGFCHTQPTVFSASIPQGFAPLSSFQWFFDGSAGAGSMGSAGTVSDSLAFDFPGAGSYTVTLVAENIAGCVDSFHSVVTIHTTPDASFDAPYVCEGLPMEAYSTASSTAALVLWDVDNNGTADYAGDTLHHVFTGAGMFNLRMVVADSFGCADTLVKPVRIYPAPQAAIGLDKGACKGKPLEFFDESQIEQVTPGGDYLVAWEWHTSQGDFTTPDLTFIPQDEDTLHVVFWVWSNHGCKDSLALEQVIYPLPEAGIGGTVACSGQETTLFDSSTVAIGKVNGHQWFINDSLLSESYGMNRVFPDPGIYFVRYVATSEHGCSDTMSRTIRVLQSAEPSLEVLPDMGCAPLEVQLMGEASFPGHALHYDWYVDGQLWSSDKRTSLWLHNDTDKPVEHDIRLAVTTDEGCRTVKELKKPVFVMPVPVAEFSYPLSLEGRVGAEVRFDNLSRGAKSYVWTVSDGYSTHEAELSHVFSEPGVYRVELAVANKFGCRDTVAEDVRLTEAAGIYIPGAFTPNADGINEGWGIYTDLQFARFEVAVRDRWGQCVFESSDAAFRWDGTTKSAQPAPSGQYSYKIFYISLDGISHDLMGTVMMIR